jgi:protein-disulfide isomerase
MRSRFALAVALACTALLAACGPQAGKSATADAGANAANGAASGKFTASEYVMGKADAPVTVIEYLSNTCTHCAAFDATTWPKVKAKFVDTGKVKWIVREFLTPPEQVSAAGFVLARCAGRDKYFQVIESIFHSQDEMFKTGDFKTPFLRIAQSMGMNEAQFNACLQDEAAYKALYDRVQKSITVDKIDGTPTLLINGKKAFDGEVTFDQLDKALIEAGAK